MIIHSEAEMLKFGADFAKTLKAPALIELVGDVGVGKTTFTRGLAEGLKIKEKITSPSFTISKRYAFENGFLVHYDFYRLSDPGLMLDELLETISEKNTIVVIEWADSVSDFLDEKIQKIQFKLLPNGSREVTL